MSARKADPDCHAVSDRSCIELSVAWGETTLSVHHLNTPRSFRIGSDDDCDLYVPQEYSRTQSLPVLLKGPGCALRAVVPAGAAALVQLPGQAALPLEQASSRGLAQPCPDIDRALQVFLVPGMRVSISLPRTDHEPDTPYRRNAGVDDSLTLTIGWVDEPLWRNAWSFAALVMVALAVLGSAAVHAGALATIAWWKPALLEDEIVSMDHQVIHDWYPVTSWREDDPDPPAPVVRDDVVLAGSVVIDGEPGTSGEMGELRGADALLRWGNMGPLDNLDPHLSLPGMKEWQYEWWTCCFYPCQPLPRPESGGPSTPGGREDSLGVDPAGARGKARSPLIGDAHGARGLGRVGRDVGANRAGNGVGALETGTCADPKPLLVAGVPSISGPAPSQAIRPVVRQYLSRFQSCYEPALRENPSLRGRIMVVAVIGPDGQVESVRDGGSNLPAGVVECVVQTFGTLVFPEVTQGPVSVSWPFLVADC